MNEIAAGIETLKIAYRKGRLSPESVINQIWEKSEQYADRNIWIHLLSEEEIAPYLNALKEKDPQDCLLWGIPFAIKDNIDLAGIPTTAACEAFAYTPAKSATVVQYLVEAGAIPIGKTNLDQFATGLNGTRSPWGACSNSYNVDYISGGSSSGSAVAVALGLASFSLGSDTAGSGRVPAAFNNLIGVKPTLGLLSSRGMVPACRSIDTVSIFTLNTDDANLVLKCAEGQDAGDIYSRNNPYKNQTRHYGKFNRPVDVGIIPKNMLAFFGDESYAKVYRQTLDKLESQGFVFREFDFHPFQECANLLYDGPWVSERFIATSPLIENQPEALLPVVRDIIQEGRNYSAVELFKAQYQLQILKKQCYAELEKVDCILTPTAGKLFSIDEMLSQPQLYNSQLGYYTNFMNLLDLAAIAVPTGFTEANMPFGITLASFSFSDRFLLSLANRIQSCFNLPMGATHVALPELNDNEVTVTDTIEVLVCGAHMEGLPLNWQLTERGAVLKAVTQTAPMYRMFALSGGPPFRPGLILDKLEGRSIDVEVWSIPSSEFGSFVEGIPAPLGIGKVMLLDSRWVSGFICENYGLEGAEEITHLGGWRNYLDKQ